MTNPDKLDIAALEPRGCPTPGACSATHRIAALTAERDALKAERDDLRRQCDEHIPAFQAYRDSRDAELAAFLASRDDIVRASIIAERKRLRWLCVDRLKDEDAIHRVFDDADRGNQE